jgi:magnesium-protoporphyrin O-methyltransferase
MASCCDPRGCDRLFNDRFARRLTKRYRKRGLSPIARRIVEVVAAGGIDGATVLEVGGGIGEIQIELLKRGAARATNLELSQAYEQDARRLLEDAGLADRVERRIVDIAATPDAVGPADIVVLNRVVCCYPDYEQLLGAVADHARRMVVFSHPPRNPVSTAIVGLQNLMFRMSGSRFRVFAHPPQAMLGVLSARGLHPSTAGGTLGWRVAAAQR